MKTEKIFGKINKMSLCKCDNCEQQIKISERYHRTFDICNGKKEKETVLVTGCSTRCLLEWYEKQNKYEKIESNNKRYQNCCDRGGF